MALIQHLFLSQTLMPHRQSWNVNPEHQMWRGSDFTLPHSQPPNVPNSHYFVDLPISSATPHLLQPPPAPRLRSIPLPGSSASHGHSVAPPPPRDVFPVDLTTEVDFDDLARSVPNYSIPPRTTIYIFPASGGSFLLQIITGHRPTSTFSVIRRLKAIMGEPLALQVYHADLPPAARSSVHEYFLSRSGHRGTRLWQGFLNGALHPRGPSGIDLLRGHSSMWGFYQDHQGQWIIQVDPPVPML
ncbi:hypothetical protein DFH07DRAFT_1068132 [Mycena maculata]|uniref:Uncharacterized protein n=1 Tax=Mycena maculata TaxID=230809 RepID=A0AAD7MHM7_9AGAR|nr:hypothetical protein DFH07DRAFT_1068132 [Mycena maculata]